MRVDFDSSVVLLECSCFCKCSSATFSSPYVTASDHFSWNSTTQIIQNLLKVNQRILIYPPLPPELGSPVERMKSKDQLEIVAAP